MFVVCISDREEREERGSVFPPCNDKDFLWLEDGEPALDAAMSLVVALSVSPSLNSQISFVKTVDNCVAL